MRSPSGCSKAAAHSLQVTAAGCHSSSSTGRVFSLRCVASQPVMPQWPFKWFGCRLRYFCCCSGLAAACSSCPVQTPPSQTACSKMATLPQQVRVRAGCRTAAANAASAVEAAHSAQPGAPHEIAPHIPAACLHNAKLPSGGSCVCLTHYAWSAWELWGAVQTFVRCQVVD